MKTPKAVSEYLAEIGRKGGKTKGPRKARTSEQARRAAATRWAKVKAAAGSKGRP